MTAWAEKMIAWPPCLQGANWMHFTHQGSQETSGGLGDSALFNPLWVFTYFTAHIQSPLAGLFLRQ